MIITRDGKNLGFLISSALILFYMSDALNKYFQVRSSIVNAEGEIFRDSLSVSIFFRLVFEVVFLYLIVRFYDKKRKQGLMLIGGLFFSFIIGNLLFLLNYYDSNYSLSHHLTSFNKYIFVFIIFYAIKDIVNNTEAIDKIYKILKKIYFVNSCLILVGLLLNINLFKSYYNQEYRYGYNGLIPSINEATLFYMTGLSLFYFNYITQKKDFWLLVLCILASLLMGAKAMYLFLFLLLAYHILFKANYWQKVVSTIIIIVGTITLIPFLLRDKYSYLYDFFIYQYEKNGLLQTLTSGRSLFVITRFIENLEYWNFFNFLFGGTDQFKFYIEMDFFDLFLFFGAVGFVLFFVLYFKTLFGKLKRNTFRLFFCFSFFLIAFLAGHFFSSALNALYLNITVLYMIAHEKQISIKFTSSS